jgi:multiple sugar transport system substrate-binding protein
LADFFDPAWDFATVEGQRYAWPWYYGSEGEWAVNMTIAEEAGATNLAPQGPDFGWTPEEFLALAQQCTFDRDGTQVWGAYMYSNEMSGINIWPLWSFAYMFGTKLYDEATETSEFGADEGVAAFQFMYDLVEKHQVAPPGAAGLTGADLGEMWTRKELATRMSGGAEQVLGIERAIEEGTIEGPFEVLPVLPPTQEGLPVQTNGGIGVQMIFDPGDALVLTEAIKFGQYLTNPEQLEIIGNLTPLCARKSVTEKLGAGDPITQWRIEYILPTMASYSKHPQDFKIDDAWMQALQSMFGGERTPEEAAGWFQDEANQLLQEE